MRKDLDNHVQSFCPNRDYECSGCGEKGTYASITHSHYQTCEMALVVCPNFQCDKKIQRRGVKRHLEEDCEHEEMPCKYARIGCDAKMKRKDMVLHVLDQNMLHLDLALEASAKDRNANQKLLKKVSEVEKELESALAANKMLEVTKNNLKQELEAGRTTFKFRLTGFGKMKSENRLFTSPPFYTSQAGYHLNIRVNSNGYQLGKGTHVSIFVHVITGKYDTQLSWPIVGNVHFTLLNQLENRNHYVKTYNIHKGQNVRVRKQRGFLEFIPHSELGHDPTKNTQYLKDDTLYFRVAIEFPDDREHKPWLNSSAN